MGGEVGDERATGGDYYPDSTYPFRAEARVRYQRFAEARESLMFDLADWGVAEATLIAYWGDLESLMYWCFEENDEVDIMAPSTTDLIRYLDQLREQRYSLNTIARRITGFRRFYDFLVDAGVLTMSPMNGVHQRRPQPRPRPPSRPRLTVRQRNNMLAAAQEPRDRAVLALLFDRVSVAQLCRARVEDLRPTGLSSVYRGIAEYVPLSENTLTAVRAYLSGRADGPLILGHAGRTVDRFDVNRLVARLGRQAGIRTAVVPARLPQRSSRVPRISARRSAND